MRSQSAALIFFTQQCVDATYDTLAAALVADGVFAHFVLHSFTYTLSLPVPLSHVLTPDNFIILITLASSFLFLLYKLYPMSITLAVVVVMPCISD